jgi:hypothetical protein
MSELFDEREVRRTLEVMVKPGSVWEVRALGAQLQGDRRTSTVLGYFNHQEACVSGLKKFITFNGIYFIPNPVNRALLARCENRLDYAGKDSATGDQHILRRLNLIIDFDPVRPTGISASDEEKEAAHQKMLEVYKFLRGLGWPEPIMADSGNGYHLRYGIDLPCDDGKIQEQVLALLAHRFDDERVKIDRSIHNPARIIKLYGTLAAKGDNTKERPHRPSKILYVPDELLIVTEEQLRVLVDELKPAEPPQAEQSAARSSKFDVESFLARYGVAHDEPFTRADGAIVWRLKQCPFNPDHESPDAAVILRPNGRRGFKCQHTSCNDKHWRDFRRHFEPETTSKSRRDDSEWATDLSSFTSLDEARFPAPLEDDAYYGLAGKIVQRILPETEADPAALLFTFLTGFGSMIGRTAYMIADGARHHLNLFSVTVGRTSISRKRTAWVRVKPVLELIDEDWAHNNVETGLSSGEGVIHRIRDKIDEEKPIKEKGQYTGEYKTVTVDPGIDDKRLFVLETEFCSPLKVMNREGNTLSPVLRAAWDGDDLGTLTKNSRERATKPHLSMIGHITREELRRNLNETEAANGFGNRNLWIAAKRSKSLPRGGQIPSIEEFSEPLGEALLHAQTCGELRRDDEAEELWAQIYPELSEGTPGLLGAITARAAPQILRISGLYAVLDCSSVITVPHLKAALACWRYAEASARWIFETGTGNKVADRILAALIAAGPTGLTKTQIVSDVFNRNVTKFTIDEALRLLHHLGLGYCKMETTRGRSAERWFFKSIDELNERNEQREAYVV